MSDVQNGIPEWVTKALADDSENELIVVGALEGADGNYYTVQAASDPNFVMGYERVFRYTVIGPWIRQFTKEELSVPAE